VAVLAAELPLTVALLPRMKTLMLLVAAMLFLTITPFESKTRMFVATKAQFSGLMHPD